MNKLINFIKSYSMFFIIFLVYLIIVTTLFYFEILHYKTISIINYVFMIILFFFLGIKIRLLERKKGFFNGFIISSIIVILFVLISLILSKLTFSSLIYYLSLIISSMIGGIIRANKKTSN